MNESGPLSGKLLPILVAALIAALFAQVVLSMRLMSATFDETTHLASGYSYLAKRDFRLNPQHPPLIKLLSGAPILLLAPQVDFEHPAWTSRPPDEWSFGAALLYGNDAERLLFWGRLPVVLLGLLMAFYAHLWARELFGAGAGLVALALCAFSPTVIAHSRWVTFDVGLACFSTMALYHLWRHSRGGGIRHLIGAGLGLGLALASKYSGLVLLPVFAMLWAWKSVRGDAQGEPGAHGRGSRAARALVAPAAILSLAFLVIQASYLFSTDPSIYIDGLRRVQQDHDPGYAYYLMGEFRPGGWWYYFLAAFVFKTPVPTLALIVLSVVFVMRRREVTPLDEAFLVAPVVAFTIVTSAFADNLGVRYLMPVYPLIFVYVSRLARAIEGVRWRRILAAALALWYVTGTLVVFPDHLAYFNELVGGPARGHRYLDDSNIDWGQDLARIKRWLDEHGIESVRLRYGRNANPGYYGIVGRPISDKEWKRPTPGIYAMGTHLLIRGEYYAKTRGLETDWLSRYEPIGRIGYSCYVFEFEDGE